MSGSWVKVGESWGLSARRKRTRASVFATRVGDVERDEDQRDGGLRLPRDRRRLLNELYALA